MKALITGVTGQDGCYLTNLLLEKGYDVVGVGRNFKREGPDVFVGHPHFKPIEGDITEPEMQSAIANEGADEVYLLAALQNIPESYFEKGLYWRTNFHANENILEKLPPETKVLLASSSEALEPVGDSPYAQTKKALRKLGARARLQGGFVITAVLFNHESPLRPPTFVTQRVIHGLNNFKRTGEKVKVQSLLAERDWHHAADTVVGMHMAMQSPFPFEIQLGSGQLHTVIDFCQEAARLFNTDLQAFEVEGVERVGDISKYAYLVAANKLGWQRTFTFESMIYDMAKRFID